MFKNRDILFFVSFTLLMVLFSGCTQEKVKTPKQEAVVKQQQTDKLPYWFHNPNAQNHFGAVGYAKNQKDKKLQKRLALIDAKARLAESIKVKVDSKSKLATDEKGEELHTDDKFSASQRIVRPKLRDTYVDEKGDMYVWITKE